MSFKTVQEFKGKYKYNAEEIKNLKKTRMEILQLENTLSQILKIH